MNDDNRALLEDWTAKVLTALELSDFSPDIDAVLNLAGDAARSVVRPAAPLTTFLAGFAAGRASSAGTDADTAVREAIAAATTLCSAE
ncbi:MAG: molybdopterin-guanine dinucleotide biosynthesis protein [Cryobacterium sp.]|nr:molybdopterin-guanine dinucleotide biosynthesis protein [Cryobacterium sp.]MCO5293315.1 DUF6457 domain-containing protein [Homoserinimonas sp.]MCW5945207.1 molybdopterin-guanine dinucleotide biosynthesis protein [Cryobacterium sp.]